MQPTISSERKNVMFIPQALILQLTLYRYMPVATQSLSILLFLSI